ncbi:amidase [Marivibrio halodurans]|uniref:Amidase n=1 Tax=Marivibrio halodurans TaxID=2039722 RepID=A0A8J7V1F7_9PROT|nr:amidase [Marivibrio halodurans]MBP5855777.1 amidase [Marivibrio halodurans]
MTDADDPVTAGAMARATRDGALRPTDLVERALRRIEEIAPLNAFPLVDGEGARAEAARLERLSAAERENMPLHGVPVAIKDFTPTAGHLTTRGSWSQNEVPTEDPVFVRRLKRAGAIIVGKTATPEFAYSSFTQSPRWGITRNPHDPTRTPGGSSGGSAVAVATGCTPFAEGSDMGGSIRIPAALSGVVGLKPSLGRIPMDVLPGGSDFLSHFGPIAGCVDDAALFLSVTQGADDADYLSQAAVGPIDHPVAPADRSIRIAVSPDLGYYAIAPEVAARLDEVMAALKADGYRVERVELPWSRAINDAWSALWGVALATSWGDALETHREYMDPAVVALIEAGRALDAVTARHYEAVRHRLWADLAAVFRDYDVLLCPTCARPAPKVDARDAGFEQDAPDGRYAGLDLCCPFNMVSACPAASVPIGTAEGMPVGLQIVGRRFDDSTVLRLAKSVERLYPPKLAPIPRG